MPDLAGRAVRAGKRPAVDHVGGRDPGADRDEQHVPLVAARAEPRLGQPADADVVAEHRGQPEPARHQIPQRYVPEADVAGPHRGAGLLVDHAGNRHTRGDGVQPGRTGPLGQPGGDVENGGRDRLRAALGQRRMPLGVLHRAVRADQGTLHAGAADVQRHDDVAPRGHVRAVIRAPPSG
ncbi:hypothetical protein GCM10010166_08670 [Couchioplanes caeruleus subsp. azureus]|nr:hypothetical protein GCM10010166_08670 [Couchioplanes caeruleus subsp. azureus]